MNARFTGEFPWPAVKIVHDGLPLLAIGTDTVIGDKPAYAFMTAPPPARIHAEKYSPKLSPASTAIGPSFATSNGTRSSLPPAVCMSAAASAAPRACTLCKVTRSLPFDHGGDGDEGRGPPRWSVQPEAGNKGAGGDSAA